MRTITKEVPKEEKSETDLFRKRSRSQLAFRRTAFCLLITRRAPWSVHRCKLLVPINNTGNIGHSYLRQLCALLICIFAPGTKASALAECDWSVFKFRPNKRKRSKKSAQRIYRALRKIILIRKELLTMGNSEYPTVASFREFIACFCPVGEQSTTGTKSISNIGEMATWSSGLPLLRGSFGLVKWLFSCTRDSIGSALLSRVEFKDNCTIVLRQSSGGSIIDCLTIRCILRFFTSAYKWSLCKCSMATCNPGKHGKPCREKVNREISIANCFFLLLLLFFFLGKAPRLRRFSNNF